jgi:hypothetical protein
LISTRTVGTAVVLIVKTGEPGTLVTSGGGTVPRKRYLVGGTARIRVRLGSAARGRLRSYHHLALRLVVGFVANHGGTSSRAVDVGFRLPTKRAQAGRR